MAINATQSDPSLALLVFEEGTLRASETKALPTLIAAVILFAAFSDTKIYHRVRISFKECYQQQKHPTEKRKTKNINST